MIDHVLQDADHNEIGIIGLNPHNNSPLNVGVSAKISLESIKTRNIFQTSLIVKGSRRFEIEDEPQLDDTGSFYKAKVDIVEDREEIMSEEQENETKKLSERLPELVMKWEQLVQDKGMKSDLKKIMKVKKLIVDGALFLVYSMFCFIHLYIYICCNITEHRSYAKGRYLQESALGRFSCQPTAVIETLFRNTPCNACMQK